MAEQKIHLGKFINNLDSEDLSSEKLQGVVNNVYAKAVSTHKKKAKEVEERTKEQEDDTVTFVKSNHDRLKAHKNKPEKDLNKDDAKEVEPKGKTAKGVEETKGSAVVESKQVKEARADAPEHLDVSDEEIAMELADRYYNHEIDLPRLHGSLKRLFGSTKKAVEWFADYDLARRTVRKRAGKPVEESKELNAKTPFRKGITEDSDKSFPSKKDYIDAFMGIYGCTKAWAEKQWKMAQAENDAKFANTVVDLWKRNKQVNESHDLKKNIKNVTFATKEIMKKGYPREEANEMAIKIFDDNEKDTQHTLEWFLDKILSKDAFDNEQKTFGKKVNEASYRGLAYYEYKGCYVRETPSCFVATNEHGTTIGQSQTRYGAEGIIDDYVSKKGKKTADESKKLEESAKSWVLFFDKDGQHRAGSDWSTPMSVKAPLAKQRALNHKIVWPNDAEGFIVLTPDHFSGINYDELQKLYNAGGISTGKLDRSIPFTESKKLKEAGWTDDDMAINFVVTRFPKKNEWGSTITRKWKTMESAQKFADKEFPDDERIVIRQEEVYKKNPDLFSSSSPVLVRKEDKKWYTPKEAFKESKKLTESEDDFDELKQEWQEFLELGHNNVIEFEDGDYLYFDIDFDKHIMFAGSATNTGVLRQYEIYLDPSLNLDENIAELYDEIVWNKERDKTESSGKQKLGTLTNGHELFIDTSYGSGYQLCAEDGFGNYNPWTEMGPNNVLRVIEFDSPEDVVEFAKLHYGDKLVLEDEFITESKKLTKSKKLTESQTQELEKIFKELDADYGIDVDAKLSEYTNGDYDLWVKTMFSEKGWKKFEKWLNKQGIFDKSTHFAISKAENWPLGTGDYWESGTERFTTVEDAKKFADKKFKSAAIVKIEDDRNHFSTASGESVRFKGTWMTQQDFFKLRNSGKA